MRNVVLKYTVYRLGLFTLLCVVFGLIGLPWFASVLIAGVLSFTFSLIFLGHLRDEISKQIHEKKSVALGNEDPESDLENDIVDSKTKNEKTPAKPNTEK